MYAIIESSGKQYKVAEGNEVVTEKLNVAVGEEVVFDKVVLLKEDDKVQVGKPYLENVKVKGKVVEHGKGKKIIVFKYKPKKNYRVKQGHRQPYTKVIIENIEK